MNIRAFIAIELGPEIKETLAKIQQDLDSSTANIKWVRPQNIHLTLKFLGSMAEQKTTKISQCLKEIAQNFSQFNIKIDSLGAFPSQKYPRVIWAGISGGKDEALNLAIRIEDALVSLKFPKEKRGFQAHLTLGRLRSSRNKNILVKKLAGLKFPCSMQAVTTVGLFKSTLTSAGAIYEKLYEASLRNK